MAAVAVKQVEEPRSPEREGLRMAHRRHEETQQAVRALAACIFETSDKLYAAVHRIEAAEKAVKDAPAELALHLLGAAHGLTETPPLTAKEAREELAAARDAEETNRALLAGLEALVDDREYAVKRSENLVEEAIKAAVRTDAIVVALANEERDLFCEIQKRRMVLDLLAKLGVRCDNRPNYFVMTVPEAVLEADWRAALSALESNADAPLPTS